MSPYHFPDVRTSKSPSLRGSGLKCPSESGFLHLPTVSLFTREWIEIVVESAVSLVRMVSLFTREWIEIKSVISQTVNALVSLFTREWIEICP